MTELIDKATKQKIEHEATDYQDGNPYDSIEVAYIAGATVWAERLKQERELIKDLVGYVIAYKGLASLTSDEDIFIQSLIQKAKDKSHE